MKFTAKTAADPPRTVDCKRVGVVPVDIFALFVSSNEAGLLFIVSTWSDTRRCSR